jgi:hypothetical protein
MTFLNPDFRENTFFSNTFVNPYLLQIVKKPINYNSYARNNWLFQSFRFGGKTEDFGGFNTSKIDQIASIMSFKGMGSSQFEWGAVPSAFEYFYKNSFVNFSFYLKNYPIEIYVICNSSHLKEVKKFINKLSKCTDRRDFKKNNFILRELDYFNYSIENFVKNGKSEYTGWLELSNPFFFFLDKKMYQELLNLFIPNSKHFIMND